MEIVKFPHPALLKVCRPVELFDNNLKIVLDQMWETMLKARGLGLAANQVQWDLKAFVMLSQTGEKLYIVNPAIIASSSIISSLKEGCLSMPGELLSVGRPSTVQVSFQDETGKKIIREFGGIDAICVQHELDHLNGKAFFQSDKVSKKLIKKLEKKWKLR